jgi:hypothetical protein
MKKLNTLLFASLFSFAAFGQLSGDIVNDNRKLTSKQGYIINGHVNGKIVFDIAVNAEGEVSSATVFESESTVKSTPAKIKARNYVSTFTFAPGTWYPKHHQGRIVITIVKQK